VKAQARLWLPVVVYMAAIFSLSSISQPPPLPSGLLFSDTSLHAALYAGLAAVMMRACAGGTWHGVSSRRGIWSTTGATLYGVTDEFHQLLVPGRTFDVVDMAADGIGAVIAVVVILAWGIIRRHVVRKPARRA
jgi:VanZ family protein